MSLSPLGSVQLESESLSWESPSIPFPKLFSCPWWRHLLGSNNSSPFPHAVAWQRTLGPSDRQKPGALCWAVGGWWPLECCGWLTGVVCVFTEVWGVILGVDWQVNIQRVQIYRWNVEGLAKGFFIRWWGLEWNVTEDILWCDTSKDVLRRGTPRF